MGTAVLPIRSPAIAQRRFSVDDFHSMDRAGVFHPEERLELLAGQIYTMSPIGPFHGGVTDILAEYFWELSRKRWIVRVQNPIELAYDSEPQPDLALVRPAAHRYKTRHPSPEDVFLLVEVSDTSLNFDQVDKLPLYATASIPEVWIIDLAGQTIYVHRNPHPHKYADIRSYRPGDFIAPSAFPDAKIEIAELFRRVE